MKSIVIPDNSTRFVGDIGDLSKIEGCKISELVQKNSSLLFFGSKDQIEQEEIFNYYGGSLETHNVMGFVGSGNYELTIHSRFAKSDKEDFFLHYMILKVFCPNIINLPHSYSNNSAFDLKLFLFPKLLKAALAQGLFKKYRKFEHNDSRLKGAIDVSRHIRKNIPFVGNIAYNTRQFSYDNHITQLIRHTIGYIKTKPVGQVVLSCDNETQEAVRLVEENTTYVKQNLRSVMRQNLRIEQHSYFWQYANLQNLCMQILRHEELKYGVEKREVYGILFDGAWLWEEYLATVLESCGFTHAENKTGKNPIYLFSDNSYRRYPDFYSKDTVLDAKYKRLKNSEFERGEYNLERNDLHQIISYMYILKAKTGGFIFPCDNQGAEVGTKFLNGYGGNVQVIPFYVPQNAAGWQDFREKIGKSEEKLKETVIYP